MERVPRGFQTAVDVEHGPRMVVLPSWSNIIQVFYDKKMVLGSFWRIFMMGEFIWLYENIIFMVIRCSPS